MWSNHWVHSTDEYLIFFIIIIYPENRVLHFNHTVFYGDNSHEILSYALDYGLGTMTATTSRKIRKKKEALLPGIAI